MGVFEIREDLVRGQYPAEVAKDIRYLISVIDKYAEEFNKVTVFLKSLRIEIEALER